VKRQNIEMDELRHDRLTMADDSTFQKLQDEAYKRPNTAMGYMTFTFDPQRYEPWTVTFHRRLTDNESIMGETIEQVAEKALKALRADAVLSGG
jgi:hypothetical protein